MYSLRSTRRSVAAALPLVLAGVAACGLLDTNQPNIVDADDLDTPAGAATKRLGAISIFTLAKDGDFNPVAVPGNDDAFNDNSDGYVLTSGTLADEFVNSGFIPSRTEIDLRRAQPVTAGLAELFQSLARARSAAEDAAASLQAFGETPDVDPGIPEMLALAGYTYLFFAEGFCSGVPVSHIVNDQIEFGQPLTTVQLLDTAAARFRTALAHPNSSTKQSTRQRQSRCTTESSRRSMTAILACSIRKEATACLMSRRRIRFVCRAIRALGRTALPRAGFPASTPVSTPRFRWRTTSRLS
jgi:hypothetical protein